MLQLARVNSRASQCASICHQLVVRAPLLPQNRSIGLVWQLVTLTLNSRTTVTFESARRSPHVRGECKQRIRNESGQFLMAHVCPWWGGYFIDNRFRRLLHKPEAILTPYVQDEMTVMDFGCGMGFFSITMANLVGARGRVIAVDLQQQMLDVLRKRADQAGLARRIRTHRCQVDALEIDEAVDFAFAFYAAHEVPDMPALLGDLRRCLRPGAQFLLVEPIGHVTLKRFHEMVSLAESNGFSPTARPSIRLSHAALLTKQ